MDKLIWYDNDGGIMCRRGYEVALARLASYEATGLMPEQVANAKTIIESAFADDVSKAERIRKLLAADKEDRVMILPCKVGDAVWFVRSAYRQVDSPIEATVTGFASYGTTGELIFTTMTVECQITRRFLEHQIGKTATSGQILWKRSGAISRKFPESSEKTTSTK